MPVPGMSRDSLLSIMRMNPQKQQNFAGDRTGMPAVAPPGAGGDGSDFVSPENDYETNRAILDQNPTDGNIGAFQSLYGPGAGRPDTPQGHGSMAETYGDYNTMTGATDDGRNTSMPDGQNFQPSPAAGMGMDTNMRLAANAPTDGNLTAIQEIYGSREYPPGEYTGGDKGLSPGGMEQYRGASDQLTQSFQKLAEKYGPEQAQAIIDELLNAEVLDQTAPHGNAGQAGMRTKRLSDIK